MNIEGDPLPEILYKFLPPTFPEGKIPYVETDQMFRFSQPGSLNDIYECSPSLEGLDLDEHFVEISRRRRIDNPDYWNHLNLGHLSDERRTYFLDKTARDYRTKIEENPDSLREEILANLRILRDGNLGILCLSETWKSSVMWGYYSAENTGFVLGFDTSNSFFRQSPLAGYKVQYSKKRPSIQSSVPSDEELLMSIITKSKSWKHEKEWRILAMISLDRLPLLSENRPKGYEIRGINIPPHLLNSVTFGVHCDNDIREKIMTFCPAGTEF